MDRPRRPGSDRRYAPVAARGGKRKRSSSSDLVSAPHCSSPSSSSWEDVCSICDDGGDVLCCEGRCLRSFHATEGQSTKLNRCKTLRLTEEQWKIFKNNDGKNGPKYICKNCKYNQHQCFSCGLLGSSDLSSGVEVFQCEDQYCGHFYHAKCLARLLYPDRSTQPLNFEQEIARGLKFRCPVHKCHVCKGAENKDDKKMQFAVCRRCPTVYHRKCLPRFGFTLEIPLPLSSILLLTVYVENMIFFSFCSWFHSTLQ
uniref:Zinc finger PHD-type domain-containing protein n=1 Tax=Oryza brachyantha TaxID=4533 RepID=J3NC88_ORYBR